LPLDLTFDPARLRGDLDAMVEAQWIDHFVPQHYDGNWSVLPLRVPAGATHPILRIAPTPGTTAWEDSELLPTCRYFAELLATFECPLEAVRLMRLAPGSRIHEHSDHDLAAEWSHARLHIPITTNDRVDFRLNGTRVDMTPGSVWYLRLADPHSVINAGTTDRVHLVIDAVVNPWLEALLRAAMR
jgi:quercetin dioxygenase-like cupin family protein